MPSSTSASTETGQTQLAMPSIAIVGAGPAGLTLSLLLHTRGIASVVFELRQEPTAEELSQPCGSLDLHEESGLAAIRECGVWDEFIRLTGECSEAQKVTDKDGILLHQDGGELSHRPEISRHALNKLLISHLPPATVQWGHKLQSAREISAADGTQIELDFGEHGKHNFDLVIGADGAWSQVRNILTNMKPHYVGIQVITLTIRELTAKHPHLADFIGSGSFSALGLRHAVMSQRATQDSARIYIFLTIPDEDGAVSLGLADKSATGAKKIILDNDKLLGLWGPSMKELVQVACDEEAADHPTKVLDIRPICSLPIDSSWQHNPSATLIGDAAHLMCPWAGEGANLAMWDSLLLARTIAKAFQCATPTVSSFRARLSPLMRIFEEDQKKRAMEKAVETENNGKMIFSDDGAQGFAQFFQSRYNSANGHAENHEANGVR